MPPSVSIFTPYTPIGISIHTVYSHRYQVLDERKIQIRHKLELEKVANFKEAEARGRLEEELEKINTLQQAKVHR